MLILGNFQGNTANTLPPLAERETTAITPQNITDVMKAYRMGLHIEVENHLDSEADASPLALHIPFDGACTTSIPIN